MKHTQKDVAPAFDMDAFMRACGWTPWAYGNPDPHETVLWWNAECMSFGRVGDQFFYDDVDDWERMDAFFEKYPEASITRVWHSPQPNRDHLKPWRPDVDPGPRKGSIAVSVRLTAPWPTSFDEAWDLLERWGCGADEEDREPIRHQYERRRTAPAGALSIIAEPHGYCAT